MERVANEVYVEFGSKLAALLDAKSKHSLDEVVKGLSTLVLLLTSILADPTNDEKRAIKPSSKSLARMFALLERHYLMGILQGQPKVVCFQESIYFGLSDVARLQKLLDVSIKYKTRAEDRLKARGELRQVWRRKKEMEEKEKERLKLAFYDDRDLLTLATSAGCDCGTMGGGAMGDVLKTLGKARMKRKSDDDARHDDVRHDDARHDARHDDARHEKTSRLPSNIPSIADF